MVLHDGGEGRNKKSLELKRLLTPPHHATKGHLGVIFILGEVSNGGEPVETE